jgi:hypothetical protein
VTKFMEPAMRLTVHIRRLVLPLGLTLFAAGLPGCASSPPPGRVYLVDRPPPLRVEAIPVAPGPRYVWMPGRWARVGSGWA